MCRGGYTEYMNKNTTGFTIVELLITIVVIAILAAISIVAYNGIQQRVRDTQRLHDVRQIRSSLEAFRAIHGRYPTTGATNNNNTCGNDHTNGYSYSTSTDGRWLRELVSSGTVSRVPTAPGNDCTSHYRYLYASRTAYGCTTRTTGYVILQVAGVEGMARPTEAISATWRPCPESTINGWGSNARTWTFVLEE